LYPVVPVKDSFSMLQERARLAPEYRFEVVDATITAEQEVERLSSGADVLFVPANLDTPGKKSEAIATINAGGWNGSFLLLRDRPDFEAVAQFVIYVATGEEDKI
jgi:hypothetical protein